MKNNMLRSIFLALFLTLTLAACQEERVSIALADIEELMSQGSAPSYKAAEKLAYDTLKKLKVDNSPAAIEERRTVLRALIEIKLKFRQDPQAAVDLLKQLAAIAGPEERYKIKLSMANLFENELGLTTEAVFVLQEIIATAEKEGRDDLDENYYRLIKDLFALRKYEQCREAVHQLALKCPDSPYLVRSRLIEANSFFIQEEYHKAIALHRALLEEPLTPEEQGTVYFELGSSYQMLNEQKEALGYYKLALKGHKNPKMVQNHISYMQILLDNANVEKQIRRSKLEQAYLERASPENEHEMRLIR